MNNIKTDLLDNLKNQIETLTNIADEKIIKVSDEDAQKISALKNKLVNIINNEMGAIEKLTDENELQAKAKIIVEKSNSALQIAITKIQSFHNAIDKSSVAKEFDDFINEEKIETEVVNTKKKATTVVNDLKDNAVTTSKKATGAVKDYLQRDDVQENIEKAKTTTVKLTKSGVSGLKNIFAKVKNKIEAKNTKTSENTTVEDIKNDVDEIFNKED